MPSRLKAISLFSCIGVAEHFLQDIGIDVVVASDIDSKRCEAHKFLYPHTTCVCGDIRSPKVKKEIIEAANERAIDLVLCTPPCQGMSSAGKNRSYNALVTSKDERNSLILESFDIIDYFHPKYVLFENVPRLLKIELAYQDGTASIEQILSKKYGDDYIIKIDILNSCNFSIPQNRERCFIRMFKKGLTWKDPVPDTHIVTLREAIGNLPSIEPGEDSGIKNHWARKHPETQISWMRHTPEGCSAVLNETFYPQKANGERIKSYPNCYKRMIWDAPAPTVTMRNEIISSQDKVHPGRPLGNGLWSDARVLTLRELLIVMSLPPDLDLPRNLSDAYLRQCIGEGIPAMLVKKLMQGICKD